MIAFLQGQLIHLGKDSVTLLTKGVGYEVFVPNMILDDLILDAHTSFWIHTVVRDDAISLFGFLTKEQRHLFVSLLKVDRVGPKKALQILSSNASADQIITMIQSKDVKSLSALPKVGQKMAEQIIFKLKGQLNIIEDIKNKSLSKHQTIASALINLGYKMPDIEKAILHIPKESSLEDGVKASLAFLSDQ